MGGTNGARCQRGRGQEPAVLDLEARGLRLIFEQQGLMVNLSKAQNFLELSDKTTAKRRVHCALTALAFLLYEYGTGERIADEACGWRQHQGAFSSRNGFSTPARTCRNRWRSAGRGCRPIRAR